MWCSGRAQKVDKLVCVAIVERARLPSGLTERSRLSREVSGKNLENVLAEVGRSPS